MYERQDGSISQNKGERQAANKGQALAGSQGRNSQDPARERRGAQSEQEVAQRYSQKHFTTNADQQLELSSAVTDPHAVACLLGAVANLPTTYTKVGLTDPTTSVGDNIVILTDDDVFRLAAGYAYMVVVSCIFHNTDSSTGIGGYVAIADSAADASDILARNFASPGPQDRLNLTVSCVIDNRNGAIPRVEVRARAATANKVDVMRGQASVFRL